MKRSNKGMIGSLVGLTAGVAAGIAANSAAPEGMNNVVNALKVAIGAYVGFKMRTSPTMLYGGLGLAAEGVSELIAQYTSASPSTWEGPKLFGFPGVYTSPGYLPYSLNGIGATSDAGVTEQMRY